MFISILTKIHKCYLDIFMTIPTKKEKKENKEKIRVIFVCLGNICRSPAAEEIFRKIVERQSLTKQFMIDSAGTSGQHSGELPDRRMREAGAIRGYNFSSISRRFEPEDFDAFDYVVTMDDSNYSNVLRLAPNLESRKKVKKMIDYSINTDYDHIPDPYYEGAEGFELVLNLLEDACEGLLESIEEERFADEEDDDI